MTHPKTLYCIDLDGTLVKGHLHNYLMMNCLEKCSNKLTYNFLQDFQRGLREPALMKELFEVLHKNGQPIAITTFSSFPEVIPIILSEIGLSEDVIASIHVVHGLAHKLGPPGKNGHIQQAKKHFQLGHDIPCLLIDDDVSNTNYAKQSGHSIIHANPFGPTFVDEIGKLLCQFRSDVIKSEFN